MQYVATLREQLEQLSEERTLEGLPRFFSLPFFLFLSFLPFSFYFLLFWEVNECQHTPASSLCLFVLGMDTYTHTHIHLYVHVLWKGLTKVLVVSVTILLRCLLGWRIMDICAEVALVASYIFAQAQRTMMFCYFWFSLVV